MILDFLNYLMLFWTLPNLPHCAKADIVDFIFEITKAHEYFGEGFGRLFHLFEQRHFS